ncbi:MAG: 50S ribosomal protein L25 [Candidatus Limnocylindrales bacterium]
MSTRPQLSAESRDVIGKKVAGLRRQGILPAVVYGHDQPSQAIQLHVRDFDELRRHAGRNALVDLKVGSGRSTPVLLHEVHEHPVTRRALHADFLVVRMTEEMTIDVPISIVGESLAVDKMGGTLLHLRDNVQVRALPVDLPSSLELDITPLETFEQTLHVSDLVVPEKVTLLTDPTEPVARIQPPRQEAEPVVAEEAAEQPAEEGAEESGESEESSEA